MGRAQHHFQSWPGIAAALAASALMLAACGGGGGGGGSTPPTPPGPGDTEKLFPDSVGDTWFYDSVATNSSAPGQSEHAFQQLAVTGTRVFGATTAKVFLSTSPQDPTAAIETYYSRNADGVTNHGNNDPADTLTASTVPYLEGRFPVATGVITDVSKSNVDFGQDVDGDGRNERVDFTLHITMDGFEALAVPAGSFSRTARRTSKIDGTVHATGGGSAAFTALENLWSAPGVGVVKQVTSVTAGGQTLQQTSEARGYKVDGVAHGIGLPSVFLTGLVPANSDAYMPGPPPVAFDGSSFLLATIRQSGTAGTIPVTRIVAAFGDADGTLVREIAVTSDAPSLMGGRPYDVAFDGTNYLLLYSNGTSSSTPNPLLGTRISPSGALLDGAAGFEIDEGTASFAAITYGGGNYLVVFTRFDGNVHQLFGRFISPAGNVVGATEFPIGARDRTQLYPDTAFDGTNFLVTWQQTDTSPAGTHVMAARVTQAGAVLEPDGFVLSDRTTGSYAARIAFGGGQYLVVWQDQRNSTSFPDFDIYAARVSTDGALLDGPAASGGIRVTGSVSCLPRSPDVIHTGSEFLVAWAGSAPGQCGPESEIFIARVSNGGTVTAWSGFGFSVSGEPPASSYSNYEFPAIIRFGTRFAITWLDNSQVSAGTKGLDLVPVYSIE